MSHLSAEIHSAILEVRRVIRRVGIASLVQEFSMSRSEDVQLLGIQELGSLFITQDMLKQFIPPIKAIPNPDAPMATGEHIHELYERR